MNYLVNEIYRDVRNKLENLNKLVEKLKNADTFLHAQSEWFNVIKYNVINMLWPSQSPWSQPWVPNLWDTFGQCVGQCFPPSLSKQNVREYLLESRFLCFFTAQYQTEYVLLRQKYSACKVKQKLAEIWKRLKYTAWIPH